MNFRLLRADEIDCRISSIGNWGVQLLLYKDARCDMNILDETVGAENWSRKHKLINGNLFCSVGIYTGDRWVWKQDVGVESYTEKEKGEASDSFKRACFNWGIGRELYTAPQMFVRPGDLKTLKQDDKGKWTCKDYFIVTDIEYNGKRISLVEIENLKTNGRLTFGMPSAAKEQQNVIADQKISKEKAKALADLCQSKGLLPEVVCARYGVSKLIDMTEDQHTRAVRALERYGNNGNT